MMRSILRGRQDVKSASTLELQKLIGDVEGRHHADVRQRSWSCRRDQRIFVEIGLPRQAFALFGLAVGRGFCPINGVISRQRVNQASGCAGGPAAGFRTGCRRATALVVAAHRLACFGLVRAFSKTTVSACGRRRYAGSSAVPFRWRWLISCSSFCSGEASSASILRILEGGGDQASRALVNGEAAAPGPGNNQPAGRSRFRGCRPGG